MHSTIILSIAAAVGIASAATIPASEPVIEARQPKSCGNVGAFAYLNQPFPPTNSAAHAKGCTLYYCDGNTGQLQLKVQCTNGFNKCQLTPSGQGFIYTTIWVNLLDEFFIPTLVQ
ncbi:hypothetical protein B0T16DRAFT_456511 [Cercophora newfieldiana]|uniref:Uncharacterized protein n=1 Tax=Cercophora newfieldiana TaxID=92897 RepID=A0AA39YAJ2_9PEZI|nr:hypothetical protein B0T16DRAFT_456511 [Cercophora newfieldiana]